MKDLFDAVRRSSYELEVILNFDGEHSTWAPGQHQPLGKYLNLCTLFAVRFDDYNGR